MIIEYNHFVNEKNTLHNNALGRNVRNGNAISQIIFKTVGDVFLKTRMLNTTVAIKHTKDNNEIPRIAIVSITKYILYSIGLLSPLNQKNAH